MQTAAAFDFAFSDAVLCGADTFEDVDVKITHPARNLMAVLELVAEALNETITHVSSRGRA